MAKRTRSDKAEQSYIPGTEPVKIPAVHRAIAAYVQARDARMALTKTEVERRDALLKVMRNHQITSYAVDGHEATLSVEESVKAKLRGEDETGGDAD